MYGDYTKTMHDLLHVIDNDEESLTAWNLNNFSRCITATDQDCISSGVSSDMRAVCCGVTDMTEI